MSWAAVRLRPAGPLHYTRLPETTEVRIRQRIVVRTDRATELATVVRYPDEPKHLPERPLTFVRPAETQDLLREQEMAERSRLALKLAKLERHELGLPMKISEAHYSLDGQHLVVYFVAEQRVDFRELVRRLAKRLSCRVELRQVGVREEAGVVGGIGPCGNTLCCATWLARFEPVNVRAAKTQCLSLHGDKLAGVCGKLKCCLNYELEAYRELREGMPKERQWVRTPEGWGRVVHIDLLRGLLTLQAEDGRRFVIERDGILEIGRPQQQQQAQGGKRKRKKKEPRGPADEG